MLSGCRCRCCKAKIIVACPALINIRLFSGVKSCPAWRRLWLLWPATPLQVARAVFRGEELSSLEEALAGMAGYTPLQYRRCCSSATMLDKT